MTGVVGRWRNRLFGRGNLVGSQAERLLQLQRGPRVSCQDAVLDDHTIVCVHSSGRFCTNKVVLLGPSLRGFSFLGFVFTSPAGAGAALAIEQLRQS